MFYLAWRLTAPIFERGIKQLKALIMLFLIKNTARRKSVRIWSYSGPNFSRIFLHSDSIRRDTYSELFWSECVKRWTRIAPYMITFNAVNGDASAIANVNTDAHVPIPRYPNGRINH